MSSRLRSLDSKISFFAFADIITAVSGVLIFVALLLATDLGKPTDSRSQTADAETEMRLQKALARQIEVDAQNQRLQTLLAKAETAPSPKKLEADISSLRAQLEKEKVKNADVIRQLAASQSAIEARDRTLGLADLKVQIQRVIEESDSTVRAEAKAREEMAMLEQRVASIQSKLMKLRGREGKLWLIPDKTSTTKEPVLVTISGSGVKLERFDQPDNATQLSKNDARTGFDSYLAKSKPLDQYFVFLIRPSGIELFGRLVKLAREKGFEVGFDALEENREIHFTTPPSVEESPVENTKPSNNVSTAVPASSGPEPTTNAVTEDKPATNSRPAAAQNTPVVTSNTKSWWQRLLEYIGIASK